MGKQRSRKGKGLYAKYSSNKTREKHKSAKLARIELLLAKRKEKRLEKFKNVNPLTVSGTTLKLMRKWSTDVIWKQVKGKEVRKNYREKK
jgi:hypothetical protein